MHYIMAYVMVPDILPNWTVSSFIMVNTEQLSDGQQLHYLQKSNNVRAEMFY